MPINYLIILAIKRREPTIDFQTAKDAGLAGLKMPSRSKQLLARQARIPVSQTTPMDPVTRGRMHVGHCIGRPN